MRTLYAFFALISLVLVALVVTAAPGLPTLIVTCDPSLTTPGNCTGTPTFSGGGLNPHKDYAVVIGGANAQDVLSSIDKQGNYSEVSSDGALIGTFTFTLWQLDRNGNLYKQLADGGGSFTFD